jgi:hypothetical protein
MKAQSEAEIEALRHELDCMKQATSTLEETLRPDETAQEAPPSMAPASPVSAETASASANATATETSIDPTEEPAAPAAPSERDALDGDAPRKAGDAATDANIISIRIPDDLRPDRGRAGKPEETPVPAAAMVRLLPPMRLAFLTIIAVVAVASYLVASNVMEGNAERARVAMGIGIERVNQSANGGALQGTATDPDSIAEASAALDAELARLQALSRKVESLRLVLSERRGAGVTPVAAGADQVRAAERAPAGANWLLYMPVERAALVHYLAGRSWPGIQMAAQQQ